MLMAKSRTQSIEELASGACADQPINVKSAEREYEGVDRAKDHERDRRLARRQERRHGIGGSQNSINHPRLTADFSGEPAGEDRNEGQGEAQESRPKQESIALQALLETQIGTEPGEPQH